ncbi:O-antigen polymerase [Ethanoligenens harbinense YUAN-3]|uniref:O-antigen polymerase n=2 Tax=Ethanoligenens harbinense TaxID=253239 RepID=E6U506_ETHHY|nr:O-antigen polymerase [Ethanoligenens harbinense YUAN-3]AVQ95824.1 O-antigen ligase domain-containing protein [Ethanoligenens harbinense YUAN-3]AYF38485.1 O-antigen ligase domain-containing protein [Ethanoligenens harbinense]AYF41231.1 O-antigen ligase domain-containing protein [Ethanoligenens harbinense]QCN92064.1 O-antigen ligase domain-containing protein [Ethanoligenens harbinense]
MRKTIRWTKWFRFAGKAEKWLFINVCAMFLPFFVCVATIGTTACAILLHRDMSRRLATFPHGAWLILWGTVAVAAAAVSQNFMGLLFSLFFCSLILFAAYYHLIMTDALCKTVLRLLSFLGIMAAGIAVLEKIVLHGRVSATVFNANYYGYICELLIVAGVYAWLQDRPWRRLHAAGVAVNAAGIFLAGCYFAWLAAFVGIVVLFFCLGRKRSAFFCLSAAGIYGGIAWFFPKTVPTTHDMARNISARIYIWKTSLHYFLRHILFGNGMLTFFFISKGMDRSFRAHAHNLILDTLLNYGIIGTALLAVFVFFWIRALIQNRRTNPSSAMCLGVCAATFVHGLIDVPIIGFQSAAVFFLLMALAVHPPFQNESP